MNDSQKILLEMRASLHASEARIFAIADSEQRDAIEKAMHDADRVLWAAFEAAGGSDVDWIFGGVLDA